MKLIDLHTHSNASDGTMSPSELVCLAAKSNISVLALTDHDSISGCIEAREASKKLGINFISGVEISADDHKKMHILGLGIDPSCSAISTKLDLLRKERYICAERISNILSEKGFPISFEEVLNEAGGSALGKPHIAKVLMKNGEISSIEEAFDRIFTIPEVRAVKKVKLSSRDAISLIHEAGGYAVLAHPYQMKKSAEELHLLIGELKASGLDGIECWYSKHTPEMLAEYLGYAEEFDLMTSIGSDFHGSNKPGTEIGTGIDDSLLSLRKIEEFDEKIIDKILCK